VHDPVPEEHRLAPRDLGLALHRGFGDPAGGVTEHGQVPQQRIPPELISEVIEAGVLGKRVLSTVVISADVRPKSWFRASSSLGVRR